MIDEVPAVRLNVPASQHLEANRATDFTQAISRHAFGDSSGRMGCLLYDFGNVYQAVGPLMPNASALFRILVPPANNAKPQKDLSIEELNRAEETIDRVLDPLGDIDMNRPDASLIESELRHAASLLKHACRKGRWLLDRRSSNASDLANGLREIVAEHQRIWLVRNRPGGLADSSARLEKLIAEYESPS